MPNLKTISLKTKIINLISETAVKEVFDKGDGRFLEAVFLISLCLFSDI